MHAVIQYLSRTFPLNSNLPVTFGLVEDAQLIEKEACERKKRAEI